MVKDEHGDTPEARNFGLLLKQLRDDAGISERSLAERLEISRSKIQRWERGRTVPDERQLHDYLAAVGASAADHNHRMDAWKTLRENRASEEPGIHSGLLTLKRHEEHCTTLTDVSPLLVPGLLQTPEYMRTVMQGFHMEHIEERMAYRIRRQAILTRRPDLFFTAYLTEHTLRQIIGSAETTVAQLCRILDMERELPNVTIRVAACPASTAHPALGGPFILFRFSHATPVVHLEHYGGGYNLTTASQVVPYERAERILKNSALSEQESVQLIADIAKQLEEAHQCNEQREEPSPDMA